MKPLEIAGRVGRGIRTVVSDHDTVIMTAGVVAGVAGTVYLTHKAALRAHSILEEADYTSENPLTFKDRVKLVWKVYVPPFAAAVATVTLAVSTQLINQRRQARIIEAYLMAKQAKEGFEEKTKEVVGKNKVEKIKDEIVKDKIDMDPPTKDNVELTTYGDTLCYDDYHKRYFRHDINKLKQGFNELVERFNAGEIITYYDIFWDIYGITAPDDAADKVWKPGFNNSPQPTYRSILAKDDTPCFAICWDVDRMPQLKMSSRYDI